MRLGTIQSLDMQQGDSITVSKIDDETYTVACVVDGKTKQKEIFPGQWIGDGIDICVIRIAEALFRELYSK